MTERYRVGNHNKALVYDDPDNDRSGPLVLVAMGPAPEVLAARVVELLNAAQPPGPLRQAPGQSPVQTTHWLPAGKGPRSPAGPGRFA